MWRRLSFLVPLLVALACASGSSPKRGVPAADRKAIEKLVLDAADLARRAWDARDASLMIPESTTASVQSPLGVVYSPDRLRQDLQHRMDRVIRIDTMDVRVDSMRASGRDSIFVYSTQRFVRMIRQPEDGREGQRFSLAIHEQLFVRTKGVWSSAGPERQLHTRNWWAGDSTDAP